MVYLFDFIPHYDGGTEVDIIPLQEIPWGKIVVVSPPMGTRVSLRGDGSPNIGHVFLDASGNGYIQKIGADSVCFCPNLQAGYSSLEFHKILDCCKV